MSKNLEFKFLVPPGARKLSKVSSNDQQVIFFKYTFLLRKYFIRK